MAKKVEKMTDEEIMFQLDMISKEKERRQALKDLPSHPLVNKVFQSIQHAVKDTGAQDDDVRIAEMLMNAENIPEYVVKVNNALEMWKEENAIFRNPKDRTEYWYSPDSRGNPPKWIRDAIGKKPSKENSKNLEKDMQTWLTKLERFRVNKGKTKKTA